MYTLIMAASNFPLLVSNQVLVIVNPKEPERLEQTPVFRMKCLGLEKGETSQTVLYVLGGVVREVQSQLHVVKTTCESSSDLTETRAMW